MQKGRRSRLDDNKNAAETPRGLKRRIKQINLHPAALKSMSKGIFLRYRKGAGIEELCREFNLKHNEVAKIINKCKKERNKEILIRSVPAKNSLDSLNPRLLKMYKKNGITDKMIAVRYGVEKYMITLLRSRYGIPCYSNAEQKVTIKPQVIKTRRKKTQKKTDT